MSEEKTSGVFAVYGLPTPEEAIRHAYERCYELGVDPFNPKNDSEVVFKHTINGMVYDRLVFSWSKEPIKKKRIVLESDWLEDIDGTNPEEAHNILSSQLFRSSLEAKKRNCHCRIERDLGVYRIIFERDETDEEAEARAKKEIGQKIDEYVKGKK